MIKYKNIPRLTGRRTYTLRKRSFVYGVRESYHTSD